MRLHLAPSTPAVVLTQSVLQVRRPCELNDTRLGATLKARCGHCERALGHCPGHFGHIVLRAPVFLPHFMPGLLALLNDVCYACGCPGVAGGRCGVCRCRAVKFKALQRPTRLLLDGGEITAAAVLKRVLAWRYIDSRDSVRRFVVAVLAVPPLTLRPSTYGPSDFTYALSRVLAAPEPQEAVDTLFVRSGPPGLRGKKMVLWADWARGKGGFTRRCVFTKRSNHCLRTVISPGPRLRLDQVGVPRRFMAVMTIPVLVTAANAAEMQKRATAGPAAYPGATQVSRGGDSFSLRIRRDWVLAPGDVLHRYLEEGDWVAMNRQPTLDGQGFRGHRVVGHDDLTLKLNPSACEGYGADFDGDEMNMHVPQTLAAAAEVELLLAFGRGLTNPRDGSFGVSLVQDAQLFHWMASGEAKDATRAAIAPMPDPMDYIHHVQQCAARHFTGKEAFTLGMADFKGGPDSRLRIIIESGARAKPMHFDAACVAIGDQYVDGKCVGTVTANYRDGVYDDAEYFALARQARFSNVECSIGTFNSGYLQRQLSCVCQDVVEGGVATGILAAVSIGRELTQASLSNFKLDGKGSLKTLKIKEIRALFAAPRDSAFWTVVVDAGEVAAVDYFCELAGKLFSEMGVAVKPAHFALVARQMIRYRSGISRHARQAGFLARAAFEESTHEFVDAAIRRESDGLSGASACIMFGLPVRVGSAA